MTAPFLLYSMADVAEALGVSRSAVCNWMRRYDDTPEAEFVTTEGLRYWSTLIDWRAWRIRHMEVGL